ncbi:pyridoxal-dependent decarboxylase [Leisingera sp. ANG59]|uniref:pyridoxal phosphate-dependent decarboxylase family protein n=1 Tax=Leisingera sp. ANG59 TaxID=2675221 RepID=UPI001571CE2E|nr:pyridoxal-dependent decarboxylase [Leisingera sp. ANG59]NSY39771.1 glutamate decarboxylase [Leisingera sp. ANG59]
MERYSQILNRLVQQHQAADRPVCHVKSRDEFAELVDVGLDSQNGSSLAEIEQALSQFLALNPDVSQLGFHKQLYSGVSMPAVLGDWVASLSNAVMHTFKVGPVANLMEMEVIRQLNQLVGFDNGEGLMVSGASQANLVSMMLARHSVCPEIKAEGYAGKQLVAYVSDQSHYSMRRAANVLGIGESNLIGVASDAEGRMCPLALECAIENSKRQGKIPFYIGLTAGTTVLGAYDPVSACLEVAERHDVWLHIDGAWGAPILFSDQHRHVLAGCERANSFTWDAHKLLNVPLTAGIILTRDKGLLKSATSGGGENYLFHATSDQLPELGELSLQSARRADCLKVWTAWKAAGMNGFRSKVDHLIDMRRQFVKLLKGHEAFEVIAPAEFLNVLFQYRPSCAMDEPAISDLNIRICAYLAETGEAFIDYASFGGQTGIRMILANQEVNQSYLDDLCRRIQEVGEMLLSEAAREKVPASLMKPEPPAGSRSLAAH